MRQSALATYDECPRKFHLMYERMLVPVKGEEVNTAAAVGTAVHAGLAEYHRGETTTVSVDIGKLDLLSVYDPEGEVPVAELQMVSNLIADYIDHVETVGLDAGYTTEMVEERVEVLISGVKVHGTIDLLMRTPDGGLVVEDIKTVAQFRDVHPADFQLRTYAWLVWRTTGEVPRIGRHRFVKRNKRTARAKPPFVQISGPVFFSEDILERHEQHITDTLVRIKEDVVHRPITSSNCGWKCPYYTECSLFDDPTVDIEHILATNYTIEEPKT